MSYKKRGRFGSRPGTPAKGQQTRDQRELRERQRMDEDRRMMNAVFGPIEDALPSKDHLPGTEYDRFGQVYRKGGADSRDLPNGSRTGRGYSDDSMR